jgi:hypothetical protein
VNARTKAWVCGRSLAGIVGSKPAVGMNVSLLRLFLLSGRGLCNWLITHPTECGVSERDRQALIMGSGVTGDFFHGIQQFHVTEGDSAS